VIRRRIDVKKTWNFSAAAFAMSLLFAGSAGAFSVSNGTLNQDRTPWPAVSTPPVIEFEARIGNHAANGDWELGHKFNGGYLGTSGQYAWVSNSPVNFSLNHNSTTGEFTMSLPGGISTTWDSGRPCQAVKEIWILIESGNIQVNAKVKDVTLANDGGGASSVLGGTLSTTSADKKFLRIDSELFENFTLQGQIIFEWVGQEPGVSDADVLMSVVFADNQDPDGDTFGPSCDCDNSDASMHPGAAEICDGKDNDCDGTLPTAEVDDDSDQYVECTIDSGGWDGDVGVIGGDDCDDNASNNFPGNAEICDGADNDCDTVADNGLPFITYYRDSDSDTYGNVADSQSTCSGAPAGYVTDNTDCDDALPAVNPGASEATCDGVDNDCNASTLDEPNVDGDGATVCTDCDDNDPFNWPGNEEVCGDKQDNNCDFAADEGCSVQDLYDVSENGSAIQLSDGGIFRENLICNRNITINLVGGYNAYYDEPPIGWTMIDSASDLEPTITISNGKVIVENIIFQ
jgi:hypothetical protein